MAPQNLIKLGVDTGGTFTDFILQTPEGIRTLKLPSTPREPARAIMEGVRTLLGKELPAGLEIIHGTTVGTNAFLERKGARLVLITTRGFEDVLFLGRQNRASLYDLEVGRPAELLPPARCLGVRERIRWDGSVAQPLGSTVGKRLRRWCGEQGAQAVAVCLLHAYANPSHEQAIGRELARLGVPVSLSSQVLPEFREYERLTTTVINAYLVPVISSYLRRLALELGPAVTLSVQQSNGGVLPARAAAERAVHTVLSGPAGGVHGAFQLARESGLAKMITFDMGGTSTDVSLCDGRPGLTREYAIDGYPVRVQVMDIHTVGAGGGSLARVDAGGLLQVGPGSAGADPGPVCYGRGQELTVTDANLFLGRLLPDRFLGGAMGLRKDLVELKMVELAQRLQLDPRSTALGIVRIVNAGMAKALRAVSLERGHDPKEFSLFSFGGAAGLHCCELARELGMRQVVIPARAGILSAQGMVAAEPTLDRIQPFFLTGRRLSRQSLERGFRRLRAETLAEALALSKQGEPEVQQFLELRYQGQSYELKVPYGPDFAERFHAAHQQAFGYSRPGAVLEVISMGCTVRLRQPQLAIPRSPTGKREAGPVSETAICFRGEFERVPVYSRSSLAAGQVLPGPALIADDYTTVLLPEGCRLRVDELANLIIAVQQKEGT